MRKTAAVLGLLFAFTLHGEAAPELVRDFRKSIEAVGSQPRAFFSNGEVAYFFANDGNGHELWTSDGTAEGTRMVADLTAGSGPDDPEVEPFFVASGDLVYFWHRDFFTGVQELWRTDGTQNGTFPLTRRLEESDDWPFSYPGTVVPLGERGAFIADYTAFVTDGTVEGTRRLDLDVSVEHPVALNGLVYFVTYSELWRTDGTEAGTIKIKNVDQELGYDAQTLVHGGAIYILARSFENYDTFDIFRSDGTAAGTSRIASVTREANTSDRPEMIAIDAAVFVLVPREETTHIMRIDAGGATLVRGVSGVFDDDSFRAAADDFFVFTTYPQGLWRSDGTTSGTRRMEEASPYSTAVTSSHVLYLGSDGLYADDGTSAVRITTNAPDYDLATAAVGDRFILELEDEDHGSELWISDGTASGTELLKNIHPDDHSEGSLARRLGEKIFFRAHSDENGLEPWIIDREGLRVIDVKAGEISSEPYHFTEVNGRLLFFTHFANPYTIRSTNGEALHTFLLPEFAAEGNELASAPVIGDRAFVFGRGYADWELWTTDGTLENTARATTLPWIDDEFDPVAAAGVAFFVSDDALWRTDATLEGTFALASNVRQLHAAGDQLFFIAEGSAHGRELWVSDGTLAGTHVVKDIRPGRDDAFFDNYYYEMPVVFQTMGNSVIFAADDGVHGVEPWRSDGTEAGTVLLRDVAPGPASSMLPRFDFEVTATAGGFVYFVADDGVHGRELWRTDGTLDRTELVHDIAPGQASSTPTRMRAIGDRVFFSADDGKHGRELWWASLAGPGLVADVAAGPDSSLPHDMTELDGWIYFFAMTEATGDELWRVEAPRIKRRAAR